MIDILSDVIVDEIVSVKICVDKVIEFLNEGKEFKCIVILLLSGLKVFEGG